jgi:hypothetical protein
MAKRDDMAKRRFCWFLREAESGQSVVEVLPPVGNPRRVFSRRYQNLGHEFAVKVVKRIFVSQTGSTLLVFGCVR